jgi:hypothetical protein
MSNPTMPGPDGQEMTLEQHVKQSTHCHPNWHELDHALYLISEAGFDGDYVRENMDVVMQTMIRTRIEILEAQ